MKKKIFAITLCIAMLAIAVVGGTLAFFVDTDAATNTFTVGNVDIKLLESTLHRDNDGATDDEIIADAETYQTYLAEQGSKMVPGRWVKKAPYVQNTGKNPAYVRVIVTQSDAMWKTTSMMEYTTAQDEGAIVASAPAQNADGTWTVVYTYTEALEPEAVTYYAPIWQFKIKDDLDNVDLTGWAAEEAVVVTVEAIQSEGFADYVEAFEAFDAQK